MTPELSVSAAFKRLIKVSEFSLWPRPYYNSSKVREPFPSLSRAKKVYLISSISYGDA
jgi:hypothetical protein